MCWLVLLLLFLLALFHRNGWWNRKKCAHEQKDVICTHINGYEVLKASFLRIPKKKEWRNCFSLSQLMANTWCLCTDWSRAECNNTISYHGIWQNDQQHGKISETFYFISRISDDGRWRRRRRWQRINKCKIHYTSINLINCFCVCSAFQFKKKKTKRIIIDCVSWMYTWVFCCSDHISHQSKIERLLCTQCVCKFEEQFHMGSWELGFKLAIHNQQSTIT